MSVQAERNEAARKLGAGLADVLSTVAIGVPLGTLADKSVGYLQKQLAANAAAAEGDDAARREARALAERAFRKPIPAARLRRGSEATLLRAERGIVPFAGRETELAEFATWYDDPAPMRWRLLTGPSGRGKTRFMQHVVETYARERGDRLLAGFIDLDAVSRAPETLAAFLAHEGEVLLVVDYAERARAQTTAILKLALMLEESAEAGADLKVRVVLIARGLSEVWEQIGVEHEDIGEILKSEGDLFVQEDLPALVNEPEARRAEFARAYAAFDKVLNPDASPEDRVPAAEQVPSLEPVPPRDDFREAVVIHLAALAAVQGAMRADEMTDTRLLDWIITRERREWLKRAEGVLTLPAAVRGRALDEAVGIVTLAAAASQEPSEARVTDLLAACPRLSESTKGEREALAMMLHDLHPGENGPVGLTPDLVGTYFLGLLEEGVFRSVFAELDEQEARNGLTKLNWLAQGWREQTERTNPEGATRILQAIEGNPERALPVVIDVAQQSGDPIGLIAAHWFQENPDLGLALTLYEQLPHRTTALREFATVILRGLSSVNLVELEIDDETKAALILLRDQYAIRLIGLGRHEDALNTCEENVALCRLFASKAPDNFHKALADCQNTLSSCLSALGRWEEALAAIEEAVALRRTLSEARPDAFLLDLASSLNNLSNRLSALGRREEALAAIEEAVALCRTLSEARPDAFLPDLASSLNNLSADLSALGRREEALAAIEEAVALRRTQAEARPDAFLPDLAGSLNNLSAHLSALGRREEALAAIEEAVALYRTLSEARPDAFLVDLATSWAMRGEVLMGMARSVEARNSFTEFLRLISPILERFPAALGRQTRFNLNLYKQACAGANLPSDHALIDPIRQILVDNGFDDPFAEAPTPPPDASTS